MIRAAIIGFAMFAGLMTGVARSQVKAETLQSPVLCGPFRELEAMLMARGAVWIARGDTPAGRIYYYINATEGEFYTIKPVGETYCLDFEKVTDPRINRDAAIRALID